MRMCVCGKASVMYYYGSAHEIDDSNRNDKENNVSIIIQFWSMRTSENLCEISSCVCQKAWYKINRSFIIRLQNVVQFHNRHSIANYHSDISKIISKFSKNMLIQRISGDQTILLWPTRCCCCYTITNRLSLWLNSTDNLFELKNQLQAHHFCAMHIICKFKA